MTRFLPILAVGTLLTGLSACKAGGEPIQVPQIPTMEVGLGGVRTMNFRGSPEDLYREAFIAMTKAHIMVRRGLGHNDVTVSEGMDDILEDLGIMKATVKEPYSSKVQEHINSYQEVAKDFNSKRYSTATISHFDNLEQSVRRELAPHQVRYVTGLPQQQQQIVIQNPLPSPVAPQNPVHPKMDPPRIPDGDVPFWMVFKAWDQADRELGEAYEKQQGGYDKLFQRVRESLGMMKQRLGESDRPQLQYYMNEYERVYSSTHGLTTLPDGTTQKDIMADLKNVSSVIRKTYNPDQKK